MKPQNEKHICDVIKELEPILIRDIFNINTQKTLIFLLCLGRLFQGIYFLGVSPDVVERMSLSIYENLVDSVLHLLRTH